MADSRRLQILKQLVTLTKTVTRANGYNLDILEVSRKFKQYSQTNNFIRANILTLDETIRPLTERESGMLNVSDSFKFRYLNFVKGTDDTADAGVLSDVVEQHVQDIKTLIYKNPTLGLDFVEETGLDFVDNIFYWDEHYSAVIIEGHVVFPWVGITN